MYTSMFRKAMLGDTATLNLDFTTGVLDSRLTFTRAAGTATYINSSGYVTTATANTPRFDYDPVTLAPRGLLIEGSATNYMLESKTLVGYSNSGMVSITSGSETDPEGTANAARQVYASSGGTYHGYYRNTSAGTNTTITVSIWAKARNYTYLFLSELGSGTAAVRFNLSTGAISNNLGAGYVSAKATSFSNGWWRCEMVVNVTASTAYNWMFAGVPVGATLNQYGAQYTGTGNAADGIYCYGFQVEAGSGVSSYIPTTTSTVTRNPDSCLLSGTNFSSWYTQGIGTVCWSGSSFRITAGHLANINTVNNDPRITAYIGAGALTNLVTNGTTQASISFGTVTANTAFKAAWRFNTNDFAACLNAGTVQTDTVGTVPTGVDRMQLGAAEGGYQFLDGWIKSIKYYPTAFTNAELQTATTL